MLEEFNVPVEEDVVSLPFAPPVHPFTQLDAQLVEQLAPQPPLHPP